MSKVICGIDPGLSGAITFIQNGTATVHDMPIFEVKKGNKRKRYLNLKELALYFRTTKPSIVFCEQQQPYPGQGAVSNYTTGANFMAILAILETLDIPYELIHPQKWQKHFSIRKDTKGMSCKIAEQLFPELGFRGPRGAALDGRADATLIAEYGRRRVA